jgi:hypothetical protein
MRFSATSCPNGTLLLNLEPVETHSKTKNAIELQYISFIVWKLRDWQIMCLSLQPWKSHHSQLLQFVSEFPLGKNLKGFFIPLKKGTSTYSHHINHKSNSYIWQSPFLSFTFIRPCLKERTTHSLGSKNLNPITSFDLMHRNCCSWNKPI